MKKIIVSFLLIAMLIQLSACQSNPSQSVIVNKNDGDFDIGIVESAHDQHNSIESIHFSDKFTSTDGSVNFEMSINQSLATYPMPVVEVIPHQLTGNDVKKVANVILDGAAIYEREPDSAPQYSKAQLQNSIARWSQYTNSSSMASLLVDPSADAIANYIDYIKTYIDLFTDWLASAPEENPHILCDWTFKKEREYNNSELAIGDRDISEDLDVIYANTEIGNIEYNISATTHDSADYKLNTIIVSLGSGLGPAPIDLAIYRAMLCRTDEPTDDQITQISEKAEMMLNKMELGTWKIDDVYVSTTYYGEIPEYKVCVNAIPLFNDVPALYGQNIQSLVSNSAVSATYPITSSYFEFSANGNLVYFRLNSPVDMKNLINPNVETMSLDELIDAAKNKLILSDAYADYGIPTELIYMYEEVANEEMVCKIEINRINYGLARINVANSDYSYYYIPAIAFVGKAEYYGKDSNNLYISSSDHGAGNIDLVWINAIDGSIIQ